jgi:transcriptional regulator with XRE-family HTH domain
LEPQVAFGRVLRELRLERGLSQEKLALDAGVQRNFVSLLERGQNAASLKTLFKLAKTLDIPASVLISRVEQQLAKQGGRAWPPGRRRAVR